MLDEATKRASEAKAELDQVTAKLGRARARARADKARADEAEDKLERATLQLGRAKVKLAERKQQQDAVSYSVADALTQRRQKERFHFTCKGKSGVPVSVCGTDAETSIVDCIAMLCIAYCLLR